MVRNQSLYEMWWLFTSLMRYPKEIFRGPLGQPIGRFFTYVIPVLLGEGVRLFDQGGSPASRRLPRRR